MMSKEGERVGARPDRDAWAALEREVIACRLCPRLVAYREEVARRKRLLYRDWEYWGRPVPGFGDPRARLWVVGLAPAAHGANRTGRIFTGDASGDWLFRALHRAGFANQPTSERPGDGLRLRDCYVSAPVRCAPPGNRPLPEEFANCRPYLERELRLLRRLEVVVTLGRVSTEVMLRLFRDLGHPVPRHVEFRHGEAHELGPGLPRLVTSYHPSRQNTQTGKLSEAMFDQVFALARELLSVETEPAAGGAVPGEAV
ncbi:MAG: uracil-DNA glycosylase [Clostridia bacterium]|nr:uracil-DNA glycosylase [Clostridia bacterium]